MIDDQVDDNQRHAVDEVISRIADYVLSEQAFSDTTISTARTCMMDALGCGMLALTDPKCRRVLGPVVSGAVMSDGCLVPGTDWRLDPVQASFNLGAIVRWLDFNDTWLAAEWGHPSDNLGGLLPVAAYVSHLAQQGQASQSNGIVPQQITVRRLLEWLTKAYEIQGVLALENSFNRVGLDHVLLVRIATAAVTAAMLGGNRDHVISAVSNAFADGGALRSYRHAPNTGSRKSWAAGDATSRGVWLAMLAMRGEMEYRSILSTPTWGFQDVLFGGKPIKLARPPASYVMDNILFKVSYPAEFHAQTAVECGVQLHSQVVNRIDEIERIEIETQESAVRIISKSGPLHNPADRDHCLQYMVAVALIKGDLKAVDYDDAFAADPRIDRLRSLMKVTENESYSLSYVDPEKRSIANAIRVRFADGTTTDRVVVEYPLGHRRRREEALPLIHSKYRSNIAAHLSSEQCEPLNGWISDENCFDELTANQFSELWLQTE